MRGLLALIAVVIIVLIILIMTGFINLSGHGGKLPDVAVTGGQLPSVKAETGSIDVGTKNTSVTVPKVETEKKKIEVPTVDVKSANETH